MRRAIVGYGNFEIFEDGRILKINEDGTKSPAIIQYYKTGRQIYPSVGFKKDGKRTSFYVHRLMAEAFLPNPDKKKFVVFKNGDPQDYRVENLMWDNRKFSRERQMEGLSRKKVKCSVCGKLMDKKLGCKACMTREQNEQRELKLKQEKLKRVINDLAAIDIDGLDYQHKKIIVMRRAGKSLSEISKELGESIYRVSQIIELAKKRQEKINKQHTLASKHKVRSAKKANSSEGKDEQSAKLRRMLIFGSGDSSRYFYQN